MKILKTLLNILKYVLLIIIDPFDTLTLSKGTKSMTDFMNKHFWIVFVIAITTTAVILFIGYYDTLFKEVFNK